MSETSSPRALRRAARPFRLILLLAAWAALAAPTAYGFGQREDPIAEADRLIKTQRYNEAIRYLTDFIKKYPDRFDEAQKKLRRIIEIREAYNLQAKSLLETLVNEPTNEEKKLAAIRNLEALERVPNKDTQTFIEKTKIASLFVYNRAKFDEIMAKGRSQIDAGRFAEAAATYESGFVLYREEFDLGPYDELTKQAVAGLVDRVKEEIAAYGEAQALLKASVETLRAAFDAGDAAGAEEAWPTAEALLLDRARRRNAVVASGRALSRQFDLLKKQDATTTDSSFLPFAFRFTLGRASEALPEGVAGAMDSQWIELLNGVQVAMDRRLDEGFAAAEAAYDSGRYAEAATGFQKTAALASPGLKVLGLWSLVAPTDLLPEPSAYGKAVLAGKAPAYERVRHLGKAAAAQGRIALLAARAVGTDGAAAAFADALAADAPLAPALSALAERRQDLLAIQASYLAEREASKAAAEELARWAAAGYADDRSAKVQGAYDGRLSAALDTARAFEVAVAARASGIEFSRIEADYLARRNVVGNGRRLLEGLPPELDAAALQAAAASTAPPPAAVAAAPAPGAPAAAALLRYPSRSATLLGAEEAAIRAFKARVAEYLRRLERETPYVAGAPSVQIWAEKARTIDREATALQAERAELQAKALDQKRAADSARLEAERRVDETRRALAAEDFDVARDRLGKAREKYLASFSLEENGVLRADSDRAIQKLGEDIVKAENDRVIRDTRRLITEGKNFYFQGVFDRSEDSLLRARARWKTTHGDDPEPEVEYWLRLVQAALSIKTGRDIAATAPLYPEMSQLLSLAKKYFDEGKRLLDKRQKTDALQYFNLAKQKINEVKVVFPLNQEAGVLALRIDQLVDPEAFRQGFGVKFTTARNRLEADPRAAYSELQDLAAIDKNYPGMKAALERAEILLGIRLPPPDPAKARRSAELAAAARRIVESGDTVRFPIALEQLNEAIQLDPNNETAVALKDRVLTFQGGTAQIVLSSYAEEQYRIAVEAFQGGNYLQALATIERLLQDPKNKRSQKLLDLYKKIQARL
ncbi:MAG: hypothetical protein JNG85_00095 [Spirochaetaceae bacterium]|nr:hypothetical protein [Spirochaetaceae bacterium]